MAQLFFVVAQARFAAFRWMQAGSYRATSPVIPPSAAYGFILNLAGIETRAAGNHVATPLHTDAPTIEVAVGRVGPSSAVVTLYQQLHAYPVGSSGKNLRARVRGQKYWIAPVRREVLLDWHGAIGVRGPNGLAARVRDGLRGVGDRDYGLPFAGDNNLLIDRIEVTDDAPEATWYERHEGQEPRRARCRLTTWIDRLDASNTETPLFAPTATPTDRVPLAAWTRVGPG